MNIPRMIRPTEAIPKIKSATPIPSKVDSSNTFTFEASISDEKHNVMLVGIMISLDKNFKLVFATQIRKYFLDDAWRKFFLKHHYLTKVTATY